MSMIPYMTTHSEISFDHDTIYDNDGIKVRLWWLGAVLQYPGKCKVFLSSLSIPTRSICK